jgi:hypothetical protein
MKNLLIYVVRQILNVVAVVAVLVNMNKTKKHSLIF